MVNRFFICGLRIGSGFVGPRKDMQTEIEQEKRRNGGETRNDLLYSSVPPFLLFNAFAFEKCQQVGGSR